MVSYHVISHDIMSYSVIDHRDQGQRTRAGTRDKGPGTDQGWGWGILLVKSNMSYTLEII